jgi:exodeoxyribonuclease V alpha subunit
VLYLYHTFHAEHEFAVKIRELALVNLAKDTNLDAAVVVQEMLARRGVGATTPSEDQARAVRHAVGSQVSVLTGGPGVGKTYTLHSIVEALEELGLHVMCCAPTGKAALRMGHGASTIHRLLKIEVGEQRKGASSEHIVGLGTFGNSHAFFNNTTFPLGKHGYALVVDEFSMVSLHLAHSLLAAAPRSVRVVLVGDPSQLPAIGPGRVLRDLIDSKVVPVTHLTQVFRQAEQSAIVR